MPRKYPLARRMLALCMTVATLATTSAATAHSIGSGTTASTNWIFDLIVDACLIVSLLLYVVGAARLWPRSGNGRRLLVRRAGYFLLGWLALVLALLSPIDTMGSTSFSMHMIQHELLMIIAPPLLVLSRPFGTWMWGMSHRVRLALGRASNQRAVSLFWRGLTRPLHAWVLHFVALWLWHAPPFFDAALRNEGVHALQHASFLFSALLFWWGVLGELHHENSRGAAILYLFTTMMHTGALGALFAMSSTVWYSPYLLHANALELTPLEDQQLGGLIMWIPGALAYVIAGLVLCAEWVRPRAAIVERSR